MKGDCIRLGCVVALVIVLFVTCNHLLEQFQAVRERMEARWSEWQY